MSDTITTFTGDRLDPLNPDPAHIHIEDIAHALPMLCRGNGHVQSFFSVGQDCINCAREAEARGMSPRLILACLLHDASECYMSDVPRPLKNHLRGYREAENRLLDVIYTKYLGAPLSAEEARSVKAIDDDMLTWDMTCLLHEESELPPLKISVSYAFRPFEEVESEYLALFHKYGE